MIWVEQLWYVHEKVVVHLLSSSLLVISFLQVNVPELSNALNPSSAPWVKLTTRLGKLVRAMCSTRPKEINLCLTGPNMKSRSRFLTSALLMGCVGGDSVNLVNAKSVASEAGVEVKVCLCEGVEGVSVTCGDVKVSGTVLGDSPVLTGIGNATFSLVQLSGNIVVAKETSLADVIKAVGGVSAVSVCGSMSLEDN